MGVGTVYRLIASVSSDRHASGQGTLYLASTGLECMVLVVGRETETVKNAPSKPNGQQLRCCLEGIESRSFCPCGPSVCCVLVTVRTTCCLTVTLYVSEGPLITGECGLKI